MGVREVSKWRGNMTVAPWKNDVDRNVRYMSSVNYPRAVSTFLPLRTYAERRSMIS
jgi:hypothetical protein